MNAYPYLLALVAAVILPAAVRTLATEAPTLNTHNGIELVRIPPGDFLLGCTDAERTWAKEYGFGGAERVDNAGGEPKRTRILREYWLGRTEVTIAQWRSFIEDTGQKTDAEDAGGMIGFDWEKAKMGVVDGATWRDPHYGFRPGDDYPVSGVSWRDAVLYCRWLNQTNKATLPDGYEFRLPTEAEWEYACRGGRSGQRFWWGNTVADGRGRLNAASNDPLGESQPITLSARFPWSDGYPFAAPVDSCGERGRNVFGLADMLGNVCEYCSDTYDPDGAHEVQWTQKERAVVLRGGGFFSPPGETRCASREWIDLRNARFDAGFRVCLGPPAAEASTAISAEEMDAAERAKSLKELEQLARTPPIMPVITGEGGDSAAMPKFNPKNPFGAVGEPPPKSSAEAVTPQEEDTKKTKPAPSAPEDAAAEAREAGAALSRKKR